MTPPATAGTGDGERLLTVLVAIAVAGLVLAWVAAQLTTRHATGDWLDVPILHAPRLAIDIATTPDQPTGDPAVDPHLFYGTLAALALIISAAALATWLKLRRSNGGAEDDGARWATRRDLKPLLVHKPTPARLTLGTAKGRLVATEHQHSVCVIGPSGTGKTTGFAIPAINEWDGPVIATTVKGDLLAPTIANRQHRGDVYVFDPTASTGHTPAGWSPLDTCNDWQSALRMAAWLVSTARAGNKGGLEDSDFWYAVAQKLLAPLLYAAAVAGGTMRDVVRWVDLQEQDEPRWALRIGGESDPIQAFEASVNREERSLSSAYTTTETVLTAFADPGVQAATTLHPRYRPETLLNGGSGTLYVCGPMHEQVRLRPLFTAIIEETIAAIYQRASHPDGALTRPLLVVLDEAANIAPLPDLAQLAATARGVGIQLVTVWQDLAQIQARYGPLAPTVINNHRAKIALSAISDTPTLDYLTRLLGDQRVTETTTTRDGAGPVRSTMEATRTRPLSTPAALRQTATGEGVLVYGNLHPAQLRLRQPPRRRRQPRTSAQSPTTTQATSIRTPAPKPAPDPVGETESLFGSIPRGVL